MLDELDEDASRASGVQEGHQMPPGTRAWDLIDELYALLREAREFGTQIRRAEGDVVQAGSPTLQETAHRGIGPQRLEDLDGATESNTNTLGLQDLRLGAVVTGEEAEEVAGV